jgi:hypothetical protein
LLLAQACLHTFGTASMVVSARPLVRGRWQRFALFTSLLFLPASWADGPATRVTRDGIYASLTVLLVATTIGLAFRLSRPARRSVPWAAAMGAVGAVYAMTREEGIWLLPTLGAVLVMGAVRAWRTRWRSWLAPALAGVLAFLAPVTAVATMNAAHYGLFTTWEVYFAPAYGALTRVRSKAWRQYVAVPRDARASIRNVSPAFREIAPALDSASDDWINEGCRHLGVCDDIGGGWFLWAFRDAVAAAGKYREGRDARTWYRSLAAEIDEACEKGRLACGPPRSTLMPPWHANYLRPLGTAFVRGIWNLITFDAIVAEPSPATGTEAPRWTAKTGQ